MCDHLVCNVVAKLFDLLPDVQEKGTARLPPDHCYGVDWANKKYMDITMPEQSKCFLMLSKPKRSLPTAATASWSACTISSDVICWKRPKTLTLSTVGVSEELR